MKSNTLSASSTAGNSGTVPYQFGAPGSMPINPEQLSGFVDDEGGID